MSRGVLPVIIIANKPNILYVSIFYRTISRVTNYFKLRVLRLGYTANFVNVSPGVG